ncbi:Selenide, water dikinase [Phycisphaerae bacterium RAS1]|nr:Selenide, water dikinase [Phycisphaerae bacterium RAS1]
MPQTGLAQVLRQLTPQKHPDLLVGTDSFDDAGVFRLSDELALVQTLDFFPPLVNDPYEFGRIAAANALSDVYAMGGEPLTAMNIVGFPDKELDYGVLVEILRGGADAVREAGAVLVGGHSVRDAEVKFGLSVTGRVHPDRIWTNASARPGDVLVLTKPLGSGVLCSAAKSGKMPESDLAEAIRVMRTLNRAARDAAAGAGVHACTDVTGFGLVGHVFEMAEGSDVTITLHAARVPLMARTLEFARQGVLTRTAKASAEHVGARLVVDPGVEEALAGVLMDAQTSGGLLLSLPADRAEALVQSLRAVATPCAAVVGEVMPTADVRVIVRP